MKKTKLLFTSLLTAAMITGCSSTSSSGSYDDDYETDDDIPSPPQVDGCSDWEWDGNQWMCDEGQIVDNNGGSHVFFYNGAVHKSSITKTSGFKAKAKSTYKSSGSKVSSGTKSGFGSGSKGGFSTGG